MPTFSIESSQGTIPLVAGEGDGPYTLEKAAGLGLPPEVLQFAVSSAGGGWMRGGRVGMRDGVLSIGIHGADEAETEMLARRLGAAMRRTANPFLVARYPSGESWRIAFFRTGGGEDTRTLSPTYERWEIDIRCPRAYWVADRPTQLPVVTLPGATVGLLPDLAALRVAASTASGALGVENSGDVEAPIQWLLSGPGTSFAVSIAGRGFTLGPLASGETVTIVRTATGWDARKQDGSNAYPLFGPAPKFPIAPVGTTVGSASIAGAGSGSQIAGWFNSLREVVR